MPIKPSTVLDWTSVDASSTKVIARHNAELGGRTFPGTTMPDPATSRQLDFTSSQAARYVGVSLATIRRWADAGHLSCYRTPGGQRRFSRAQLDDFVASLRSGAAPVRADDDTS